MQILFDNWTGRYDDECLMPGDIVEAAMVYNFRENAGNQTDTMIQMSEVADYLACCPLRHFDIFFQFLSGICPVSAADIAHRHECRISIL